MSSIPALFLDRCRRTPHQIAFEAPDPEKPGAWTAWTWAESRKQCSGLVRRLYSLGIDDGARVAIVAETCQEWSAVDMATLVLGGTTVGIYPTLLPDQIAWQLAHSQAEMLVVEDAAQYARLAPHLEALDDLRHVFCMRPGAPVPQLTPAEDDEPFLEERTARVTGEHVATVVYTSGSTGTPKGVVLRHRNLMAVIEASREALPTRPGERSVIFLPLAHVLQRVTLYRGLAEDAVGTYAPSIAELPATLKHTRPHVLATVPRMLEKIRARAEAEAEHKNAHARGVLDWAVGVGSAVRQLEAQGRRPGVRLRAQLRLAERLVFRKVHARLGGELRLLICGGAALDPELARWYEAMGFMVREGWGLTETSAPATLNTEDEVRLGSVGRPLPGVEVRVAADGELEVRGPGNFEAYLDAPEATAAAFTEDGFFRTGDLGEIDDDGFVYIRGRKKEIIVTAGGKNIAPVPIEARIEGELVGQAVLVGDERPYLVALIGLDEEALEALARARGWSGDHADWAGQTEVMERVAARVARANEGLARFEQVKRHTVLGVPLGVESGALTATLKKRRAIIAELFADEIAALYR